MRLGGFLGSLLGAALNAPPPHSCAAQFYVNAVRKLPLAQSPYLHVLWSGAGAAFGAWLVDFEERTEKDLAGGLAPCAGCPGGRFPPPGAALCFK